MWSIFSRDPSKDFAYEINEPVFNDEKSFWILHNGKRKSNGEPVSIFRYECKPNEESYMELAKNSLKRIKTLRHPSILTYIDCLETDKYIVIVTECVIPLQFFLNQLSTWSEQQKESAISWGILSLAKGLCFLNNDCKLIHGNLSLSSIFVNNLSDWKLFNLEYLTSIGQLNSTKHFYPHKIYTPPEIIENTSKCDKQIDSWGLSCVIWEIFNGALSDKSDLKNSKKLPKKLAMLYTMINRNSNRCLIQDFITKGQEKNGYFKNTFIDTMNFLEEIQIKDSVEKNRFFSNLNNLLDTFPVYFCKNKILPFVISSFEYGDANSHSLDLLFKIGKLVDENDYQKKIIPTIVKLFASKDRSIRSKLLKEIEQYVEFTPDNLVNEQIFPFLIQGFSDSNPVIREQTVKSIFYISSKLNNHNLNEEIIKHFSQIQMKDPEGGIRTNTIICLGKIAPHLQPNTRQNIMLSLFLRSLRDPFPPSRIASIQSLCATQHFFKLQDCTTKIMPSICLILMDPEKQVRDQAFITLKDFITKMEKFSENPTLLEQMESEINKSGTSVSSKFTSGISWAVSSLTAKLTGTKLNENCGAENQVENNDMNHSNNQSINIKIIDNQKKPANIQKSNIESNDALQHNYLSENLNEVKPFNHASDGWDDDFLDDEFEIKQDKELPTSKDMDIDVFEEKNTLSASQKDTWNLDFEEKNNFNNKPINRSKPLTNSSNELNQSSKPKKGPMRLGAQKLKKTLD